MIYRAFLLSALAVSLHACASLPESVTERSASVALGIPDKFQSRVTNLSSVEDRPIVAGLLDLFDDPSLDALVDHTMAHNIDLKLAASRLEQAGFELGAGQADSKPRLSLSTTVSRARGTSRDTVNTLSPSLDVSWELDVWGKLAAREASLAALLESRAEDLTATRDSIIAQAMKQWFEVAGTQAQVRLQEQRIENLERLVTANRVRYQVGLAGYEDLVAVERDIARLRGELIANQLVHSQALRTLQVLTGTYPGGGDVQAHLPELRGAPPAGLPAQVMTNRPDLRAAWQNVVAADKRVTVAHKEQFPSLQLTGSMGRQSNSFAGLLDGETIWSIAAAMTAPIFDAGKLEANLGAEHTKAEQAWLEYLNAVLRAFQEVENGLDHEAQLADQEASQRLAVAKAEQTAAVFGSRYRSGLISVLEYLSVQNTVFDMRASLLTTQQERLKNRVALALSLGIGV